MSKELTFTHHGKRITARATGIKPTAPSTSGTPTEPTHEFIQFEDEDDQHRYILLFIGEFEQLELPQDLPELQDLYDKAK